MAGQLNKPQLDEIRARVERISEIEVGALPTIDELRTGYPFSRLSLAHDRRVWLSALLLKLPADERLSPLRTALDLAIADGSPEITRNLRDMLDGARALVDSDIADATIERLKHYAAIDDDRAGELDELIEQLLPAGLQPISTVDALYRYGLAVGLRVDNSTAPEQIAHTGLEVLTQLGEFARLALAAERDAVVAPIRPLDVDTATIDEIIEQQRQAGFFHPLPTDVVVIPAAPMSTAKTGAARDVWKSVEALAGTWIAIDDIVDLATARSTLTRRYPHLVDEIDIALRTPQPVRLLLVGDPGAGKTSFARSLAGALGLHSMLYSAAGAMDSSFAGTSAHWNSARLSIPLQLIVRSRAANPVVVIDELDKVSTDDRNGSLSDALLGFLEPTSARRMMDLALEVEVDVSHVGYVATANRIEDVPSMLRDRFKIVRVPLPTLEHMPALSEHVLTDIAEERQIDRRWLEPLAPDELEIVSKAWGSRSMRQLRRLIETIINGRELLATRS